MEIQKFKTKLSPLKNLYFISLIFGLSSCSSIETYSPTSFSPERKISSQKGESCNSIVKEVMAGAKFLHKTDSTLHLKPRIQRVSKINHETIKPTDKIYLWLLQLEKKFKDANDHSKLHDINAIKRFYFSNHIIKKRDVPESYFELQKKIAREQGHGEVEIEEGTRLEMIDTLRADQKISLETWINYFLSNDADIYPIWVKYWSLEGMLKLGIFDEVTGNFSKREKTTVAPFVELNREAFAHVVDSLTKKINGTSLENLTDETLNDEIYKNLLNSGASFGKLYGRQLKLLKENRGDILAKTEGQWIKYKKGSAADELVESLKGKNTGWCTAGHSTATAQLKNGDFYVYYSKDSKGDFSNPRIAIRMEDHKIAEVRGIAKNQNLDNYIAGTDILKNKLKEFGEQGDLYTKRSIHMKRLTEIERKSLDNIDLSKEDIRFLYEVDEKIEGFGYTTDPRIQEIINNRNIKEDLAFSLGLHESQISTSAEDALRGGIKFHYGDLNLSSYVDLEGQELPEIVSGDLILQFLKIAKGVRFPKKARHVDLGSLVTTEGLILPESAISINLNSLPDARGLKLPKDLEILELRSIKNDEGLYLPLKLKSLDISSVDFLVNPKFPSSIENLNLASLKSGKGLDFSKSNLKDIYLNSMTDLDGMKFSKKMKNIHLNSLKKTNGYIFPENLENLLLTSIESEEGLILPRTVIALDLGSLREKKQLKLPDNMERLFLTYLESFDSLHLKSSALTYVDLRSLTSARGLKIDDSFTGMINLRDLETSEGLILPSNFPRKNIITDIEIP